MARIGYLEGTDPKILDLVAVRDHQLLPLGDGRDNHGKNLVLVSAFDAIDMIITHYYKLKRISSLYYSYSSIGDVLKSCQNSDTQVVLIVPVETTNKVRRELEEEGVKDGVKLVPTDKLSEEVITLLDEKQEDK